MLWKYFPFQKWSRLFRILKYSFSMFNYVSPIALSPRLPGDPPIWTNAELKESIPRESFKLPAGCQWAGSFPSDFFDRVLEWFLPPPLQFRTPPFI